MFMKFSIHMSMLFFPFFLLMLCVPAFAVEETVSSAPESVQVVVADYPDYWIAHVEAPEGEADLNTICVCIMLGSGAVCGILAGSELVKRWNI